MSPFDPTVRNTLFDLIFHSIVHPINQISDQTTRRSIPNNMKQPSLPNFVAPSLKNIPPSVTQSTSERVEILCNLMKDRDRHGCNSTRMTFPEFRQHIRLGDKYGSDRNLRKHIRNLVDKINQNTDFFLQIKFEKSKGKTEEICLFFQKKDRTSLQFTATLILSI